MDPDIPAPSIEHDDLPEAPAQRLSINTRHAPKSPAAIPLPPSSPMKSPYRQTRSQSSSPNKKSRSPSAATSSYHDALSSPTLHSKRSGSSLITSRGITPLKPQYRRASSNLNPASPSASGSASFPDTSGREMAAGNFQVQNYFAQELALSTPPSTTVVIVHDLCYGHRFSRPRTSKVNLSLIVERPERIHATLLGASAAYVRLGGKHSEGHDAPQPTLRTGQERPFDIKRTSRITALGHPSVTQVHGSKWMEELQIMCDSAEGKLAMNGKELVRPIGYGRDENGTSLPKLHEGDLYLCSETLAALQGCLGGVCDAVDTVFTSPTAKRAFVCIRPPGHHCSSNYPSGFCWLNNVHVGVSYAAMTHGLTHAVIIDFDLHHGDGSQAITWDHNRKAQELPKQAPAHKKTPIGYYSLHDINSYPCEYGDEEKVRSASLCIENAHGQSIWNVHLEPWKDLDDFWRLYESRYTVLLEKARVFLRHHAARLGAIGSVPKAAIFLSAGFDASEWEGAGMQRHKVNVPTDFYARFTADVVKLASEAGLGVGGRVVSVLEGGYSDRALTSGVLSHICGLTADDRGHMQDQPPHLNGSASELQEMEAAQRHAAQPTYDRTWWAAHHLEALEAVVAGELPPSAVQKDKGPGNYSSPTHASTAKMTEQARERRSLSAQLEARLLLGSAPPEPFPEVDWATASYELSRVLIPSDRQTLSCTHNELNAEATRARRERLSGTGIGTTADAKMHLRDRKMKAAVPAGEAVRSSSRGASRRTTIANVNDLPDPSSHTMQPLARPRRRSSAASGVISGFQDMNLEGSTTRSRSGSDANPGMLAASREPADQPVKLTKPITVKKIRPAASTKAVPKPRASPKKSIASVPPVPRVPSSFMDKLKDERPVVVKDSSERSASQSRQSSASTLPVSDGMDDLTNGMKKVTIKLKVASAEERQKKLDEEKSKKPRAPRKPAVPKATKPKPAVSIPAFDGTSTSAHHAGPRIESEGKPMTMPIKEETLLRMTESPQRTLSQSTTEATVNHTLQPVTGLGGSTAEMPADAPIPMYMDVQQDEPSSASHAHHPAMTHPSRVLNVAELLNYSNMASQDNWKAGTATQALSDNPWTDQDADLTNKAAPAVHQMRRADLPVFTSNSPIPFSGQDAHANEPTKAAQGSTSIWDVPKTPHH